MHEDCLRLFKFTDPWKEQKAFENGFALSKLKDRLNEIDKLEADERWVEICKGLLAGKLNWTMWKHTYKEVFKFMIKKNAE